MTDLSINSKQIQQKQFSNNSEFEYELKDLEVMSVAKNYNN